MTVLPAAWNAEGSYTFTVLGADADVQVAIDNVPSAADVDIESVGGTKVATGSVIGRYPTVSSMRSKPDSNSAITTFRRQLRSRRHRARTGLCNLDRSEHLRKAESKLVVALFDE